MSADAVAQRRLFCLVRNNAPALQDFAEGPLEGRPEGGVFEKARRRQAHLRGQHQPSLVIIHPDDAGLGLQRLDGPFQQLLQEDVLGDGGSRKIGNLPEQRSDAVVFCRGTRGARGANGIHDCHSRK